MRFEIKMHKYPDINDISKSKCFIPSHKSYILEMAQTVILEGLL